MASGEGQSKISYASIVHTYGIAFRSSSGRDISRVGGLYEELSGDSSLVLRARRAVGHVHSSRP